MHSPRAWTPIARRAFLCAGEVRYHSPALPRPRSTQTRALFEILMVRWVGPLWLVRAECPFTLLIPLDRTLQNVPRMLLVHSKPFARGQHSYSDSACDCGRHRNFVTILRAQGATSCPLCATSCRPCVTSCLQCAILVTGGRGLPGRQSHHSMSDSGGSGVNLGGSKPVVPSQRLLLPQ